MPQNQVGLVLSQQQIAVPVDSRRELLDRIAGAGIDHIGVGDHISFFMGVGFDGLVGAASLLGSNPSLPVHVGVYLLPLRHPVPVARQLVTISELAPGRLVLGVGVGGEDRHEVQICGVDPSSRGRRMDESLEVLRGLLTGQPLSFHGEFFHIDDALVAPMPAEPIPVLVGGRSDAAIRRAASFGEGWWAIWVSPRRFAEAVSEIESIAIGEGRDRVPTQHALNVWCGFGSGRDEARAALAPTMEAFYQLPFERFERWSPYGTAEEVADFLAPYCEAGCSHLNLIPQAVHLDRTIEGVARVKELLS